MGEMWWEMGSWWEERMIDVFPAKKSNDQACFFTCFSPADVLPIYVEGSRQTVLWDQ